MALDEATRAEIRNMVIASVRAVIDNANRYELTWRRVPATVVDGSDPLAVIIILDGDTEATPVSAVSISGGYVTNSRVMVDIVPPSGMYIIGAMASSSSPVYRFVGRVLVEATADLVAADYSGIQVFDVEVVGGGGAGGGAAITAAAQASLGAGGGAGGYARKLINSADMDWETTVTIGAGGVAVSAATGGTGGTTDFMGILSGSGGAGGEAGAAGGGNATFAGGNGGTGTGGDINVRGSDGGNSIRAATGLAASVGFGAASGLYGNSVRPGSTDAGSDGIDARVYGSGGSGGFNTPSQAGAKIGGNGSAGLVQMTLYA